MMRSASPSTRSTPMGYRGRRGFLQSGVPLLFTLVCLAALNPFFSAVFAVENARAIKLIALGDSLSAGYMLPADAAFPAALEAALRDEGYHVTIVNAGVSGDTASGGRARLDWTLADGADGVILELGANDMLRGIDPDVTKTALDAILAELKARNVKVLIAGMLASPSLGKEYKTRFDAIYPELAAKYGAPLYPFFLDGVAGEPSLKLTDGLHPNVAGVQRIVQGIIPSIRKLLSQFAGKTGSDR
jgi:acyl-CoA thioesterase-1